MIRRRKFTLVGDGGGGGLSSTSPTRRRRRWRRRSRTAVAVSTTWSTMIPPRSPSGCRRWLPSSAPRSRGRRRSDHQHQLDRQPRQADPPRASRRLQIATEVGEMNSCALAASPRAAVRGRAPGGTRLDVGPLAGGTEGGPGPGCGVGGYREKVASRSAEIALRTALGAATTWCGHSCGYWASLVRCPRHRAGGGYSPRSRTLPALARRRVRRHPLLRGEIDQDLVPPAWRPTIYANASLPEGSVDSGRERVPTVAIWGKAEYSQASHLRSARLQASRPDHEHRRTDRRPPGRGAVSVRDGTARRWQ